MAKTKATKVKAMVMVYVKLVQSGRKTIEQVPEEICAEVQAVLDGMEGGN